MFKPLIRRQILPNALSAFTALCYNDKHNYGLKGEFYRCAEISICFLDAGVEAAALDRKVFQCGKVKNESETKLRD